MIKFLIVILLAVVGQSRAEAQDYYWQYASTFGTDYTTPCKSELTRRGAPYSFGSVTLDAGGASATCFAKIDGSSTPRTDGTVYRRQCAAATPRYIGGNPAVGVTDQNKLCSAAPPPPNCPHSAGTVITWGQWTGWSPLDSGQTSDLSDLPVRPDGTRFPNDSPDCTLETLPEVVGCYRREEAGKDHHFCIFRGTSTGGLSNRAGSVGGGATGGPTAPQTAPNPANPTTMPPIASPSKSECPKGLVMAGYNTAGTPMCVGNGTAPVPAGTPAAQPATVTKATTANPDGSSTTTTTTVTTNADGSKTTVTDRVTTAPASAGGATTTEQTRATSTTPSGAAGVETKPQEVNFCKQNPTLSICRESSVSGTCGQVACMGDAIQCATLRAASAMECKQRTDEDALKALSVHGLGQAAANGTDPLADSLPSVKNASVVEMGKMEASGWIGAGSAFKDVAFTVQGKSFAVPLSKWTGYLVGLRYALMVVAMLVSFRMLSGVILRD